MPVVMPTSLLGRRWWSAAWPMRSACPLRDLRGLAPYPPLRVA